MDDAREGTGRDARSRGREDATGRDAAAKGEGDEAAEERSGEQRTTVKAESERLRAAEAAQAEHPEAVGGRGRATGEPPLEANDGDPRSPKR